MFGSVKNRRSTTRTGKRSRLLKVRVIHAITHTPLEVTIRAVDGHSTVARVSSGSGLYFIEVSDDRSVRFLVTADGFEPAVFEATPDDLAIKLWLMPECNMLH